MKVIKINDLGLFPKDEYDYTDPLNPILISEAPFKFHIYAQKFKGDEVIGYVSGDLAAFENANIPHREYEGESGFFDTTTGETVNKKSLKVKYQNQEIAKGCITSVNDNEGNPIVMQCSMDDLNALQNTPDRTFARDINDVEHPVNEEQFQQIIDGIKNNGYRIYRESQAL